MYDLSKLKLDFESYLIEELKILKIKPTLGIVQIGDSFASDRYIHYKTKKANSLGIPINLISLKEASINLEKLEKIILSESEKNSGLIIQLPIEKSLLPCLDKIPKSVDVDLLNPKNKSNLLPPTILAIDITIKNILGIKTISFNEYITKKIDFSKHKVAIIGQGRLVGKPLSKYFLKRKAKLFIIDELTKNPEKITSKCDIVICAVGKPNLVRDNWINKKKDVIIIDAGTSESDGFLVGDINKESLKNQKFLITPPKGIGGLTILSLFYNLIYLSLMTVKNNQH
jgi:methylenetetrahydrofolate dehydrogenase (NADP+) / methenyltetrahydrofolate cyclohydrolase